MLVKYIIREFDTKKIHKIYYVYVGNTLLSPKYSKIFIYAKIF